MTALLLLTHQPAEAVNRMTRHWRKLTQPDHIIVAYGGSPEEVDFIEEAHVVINDPRLRTRNHPREKQSYTQVLQQSYSAIREKEWDYLYLAEFDINPVKADLFTRLREKADSENADLLGHRALRIDDTLHPHYADHASLKEWRNWIRSISRREDQEVVLSCMGCGQLWRRDALEAVLEYGEPHPAYLEVHLPTVAHHIGFRVRGMGVQDSFIRTIGISQRDQRSMIANNAWVIHPVKTLWNGTAPFAEAAPRSTQKALHLTHFDPPIHGEAMMASQLRDLATDWDDISYFSVNAVFTENRDQLGNFSFSKIRRFITYLGDVISARFRHGVDTVILHPAFHPIPFVKESIFIWLAWLLRMRIIAWVHMDPNRLDLESRSRLFQYWVHLTLNRVDTFVACAPSLIKTWPSWLSHHPHTAIGNVIPDPFKNRTTPTRERKSEEKLRILFLSAIDSEKGWRELFDAALRICDLRDDTEFHFYGGIGNGENEIEVSQLFSTSRHSDRISHFGAIWGEQKFQQLKEADLFVFPSHTEQFPLTILEAMACALPIVSTNVGAIVDALVTPQGGRLVTVDSSDSLFSAISELLEKPSALPAMGHFNRQRFLSNFSIENFDTSWKTLLKGVSFRL